MRVALGCKEDMLYRLRILDLEAQICGPTSVCPLPHRDYASWNLSVNLYTVNAPWLFSLLWCAGVPSVTSDNAHTLSQVPSPLWIMVSWRSRELAAYGTQEGAGSTLGALWLGRRVGGVDGGTGFGHEAFGSVLRCWEVGGTQARPTGRKHH